MASFEISDKTELKERVRAETGYSSEDDLSDSDLDTLIDTTMLSVKMETGSDKWFSDAGMGLALMAYTCMRAKSRVENIPLSSYNLGDLQVSMQDTDPETNAQFQQWARDVANGLQASDAYESQRPKMSNTSGYIGEQSVSSRSTRY